MASNIWKASTRLRLNAPAEQDLGPRLLAIRRRLEMPQEDIARLLRVRTRTLDSWETERTEPPERYRDRIAEFLRKAESTAARKKEQEGAAGPTAGVNAQPVARILVVDDNPDIRAALRANLEDIGCEVFEAGDGAEVHGAVLEHKPDLLLLDVVMPKVDGFQALQALKRDERTRQLPVLILSATGRPEDFERARRLGAREYVQKPWGSGEVERRVAWELGLFDALQTSSAERRPN